MKNLVMSSGKFGEAGLCPRLFLFSAINEYEPIQKSDYLESGDLFHRMLESHYKEKIDGRKPGLQEIVTAGRNAAARDLDLKAEEVEETIKLYTEYHSHYQYETWIPLHVEEPFIKVLYEDPEIRIIVEGKIDLIAQSDIGKEQLIVDHKKTSRENKQYDRDNQKLIYCWATGINDFVINSCGTQKSKKADDRFKRSYFTYSPYQIQEWVDNSVELAFEVLDRIEKKKFPGRYTACITKFGYQCNFYNVCNAPPELWQHKLQTEFKKKCHDLFKPEEKKL